MTDFQSATEAAHTEHDERGSSLPATNSYANKQIALYLSLAEEDGGITRSGLQKLAKLIGVNHPENYTLKKDLVRAIQKASRHRVCFRSASNRLCTETDCKWRTECKKLIAEWSR